MFKRFILLMILILCLQPIFSEESEIAFSNVFSSTSEIETKIQQLINPTKKTQTLFNIFLPSLRKNNVELGIASLRRLEKNQEEIQELAFNLSDSSKDSLYFTNQMQYKKSIAWALTTGFGVGNFIQGDFGFGSLFAVADASSVALLIAGAIKAAETAVLTDNTGWGLSLLFYSILPYPMFCVDLIVSLFTIPNNGASGMFPLLQGACSVLFEKEVLNTFLPWAISGVALKVTSVVFQCIRAKSRATKYNDTLSLALRRDLNVEDVSFYPILDPIEKKVGLSMAIRF